MKEAREICPTTTMGKLNDGALLVDVRELNEVSEVSFNITSILTIPLTEFENRFNEIPKDKDVIIVSKKGDLSLRATYFLMNHGYENTFNMSGGLVKWVNKGFPYTGDKSTLNASTSCCSSDSESTSCC
jgi:rhodanese-related sulfurtransferase